MYVVEPYKLTWLNPLKPYVVNSKMFSSQVDIIYYINDNNIKSYSYMVMEMVSHDNGQYVWKVLPYGDYKSYKYGMIVSEYKLEILITFVILYYLFKK